MPVGEGMRHRLVCDTNAQTAYCSCSFRPKPCLHAQAFAQCCAQASLPFAEATALPGWADDLLHHRPPASTASLLAVQRVAAREKRRFERLERAARGLEDLETWLLDTMRRGIATAVSEEPRFYENIAARMADASLGGLSRNLRLLGAIDTTRADWAERTLGVLADCYLAVQTFRRRDHQPEALLYDLQAFIGLAAKKDEVWAQGEKIRDAWAVLGCQQEKLEEKLDLRRTWLLGAQSGRYGLLLEYAFGGIDFPPGFSAGSIVRGALAFYPSAWPLRALASDDLQVLPEKVKNLPGYADFQSFAQAWAGALGQQPWLQVFPAAFEAVTPLVKAQSFFLVDAAGLALPLGVDELEGWTLLAHSGGHPLSIFGVWDGVLFKPLSAVVDGVWVDMRVVRVFKADG